MRWSQNFVSRVIEKVRQGRTLTINLFTLEVIFSGDKVQAAFPYKSDDFLFKRWGLFHSRTWHLGIILKLANTALALVLNNLLGPNSSVIYSGSLNA